MSNGAEFAFACSIKPGDVTDNMLVVASYKSMLSVTLMMLTVEQRVEIRSMQMYTTVLVNRLPQ